MVYDPEYSRRWHQKNKERVKQRQYQWRKDHPEQFWEWHRRKTLRLKFGITLEEYRTLFASQGNKCAICMREQELSGKDMALDHNHTNGKNRGILCFRCNTKLGFFETYRKQIEEYLEKYD